MISMHARTALFFMAMFAKTAGRVLKMLLSLHPAASIWGRVRPVVLPQRVMSPCVWLVLSHRPPETLAPSKHPHLQATLVLLLAGFTHAAAEHSQSRSLARVHSVENIGLQRPAGDEYQCHFLREALAIANLENEQLQDQNQKLLRVAKWQERHFLRGYDAVAPAAAYGRSGTLRPGAR